MRIVFITTNLKIGGTQKLLIDLAYEIKKKGVDVKILCLENKIDDSISSFLHRVGIHTDFINYKSKFDFISLLQIKRRVKNSDIIHVNLFPSLYYIALMKFFKIIKNKIIYTEHSSNNNRRKISYLIPVERFIYTRYDKIVAISNTVGVSLNRWLRKDIKYKTVFNGIYIDSYERKNSNKLSMNNEIKIVMVARFSEEKDHETVVKALKLLPTNYLVFFFGDGVTLNRVKVLVEKMGLNNRVKFMGQSNKLHKELKHYDIFVLSSKWEGFGLSVLEAKASGLPTILSKVDGLYEIFKNNSLFFNVEDYKELAQKILELNNNKYLSMIEKDKLFIKKFDIKETANEYIELYNRLIKT